MNERAQLRALVHDGQWVSTAGIGRLSAVKAIAGRALHAAQSSWRASMTSRLPLLDIDMLGRRPRRGHPICGARNDVVARGVADALTAEEGDPYGDVRLAEAHGLSPTAGRGVLLEHDTEVTLRSRLASLGGLIDKDTQLPYRAA